MAEKGERPRITSLLRRAGLLDTLDSLFAELIDALPLGVALHSAREDFRIVYMNRAAIELVRPRYSDYQARSLADVMPGYQAPAMRELLEGARESGRPREYRGYSSPDGRLWDVDVLPVFDKAGELRLLVSLFDELTTPSVLRRRLEETHELAVKALIDVSEQLETRSEPEFFYDLTKLLAELIHARQAVFVRWDGKETIRGVPYGYGIDPGLVEILVAPCVPGGDGFVERIVFGGQIFRGFWRQDDPQVEDYAYIMEALAVTTALGVPWRSGSRPVGIVAAFESTRPGGFSDDDIWVARLAGLVADLAYRASC